MKNHDINSRFYILDEDKKRNVITYIMEVLVTTLAFILQIYGSMDILFRNEDSTSETRFEWMVFSILSVAVLYVWELCYREKIGWPLLVHHLVSLLLMQLATASYFDTKDIVWIRFAILLGFYATTEQISFIALFCFRLDLYPEWQGTLFYAAAAQAFVLKTIVSIAAVGYAIKIYYISDDLDDDTTNWKWFWRICFFPLLIVLYTSQLYACKILYALGCRCSKADAALLAASKTTGEGSKEIQRRGSVASIASRRNSELLLDDFENYSDQSVKRDSNFRASMLFEQQSEWADLIGSSDDFESAQETETGLHGRQHSLRCLNSRLKQLDSARCIKVIEEKEGGDGGDKEAPSTPVFEKKDDEANEVIDA